MDKKGMRNIITFLIVLFTAPVFGQNHFIGMKGGINWTNITSDNFLNDTNYRNGFVGGLTYEYRFRKRFHIEMDFSYTQKGFKDYVTITDATGSVVEETASTDFNYNYISLPVKGGILLGNKFVGFANYGVVPSFLIETETRIPADDNLLGEMQNVTDDATKFDFGGLLEIGGGYMFQKRFLLYTSFSYQESFRKISKERNLPYKTPNHYGMTISIGLKYALKKG